MDFAWITFSFEVLTTISAVIATFYAQQFTGKNVVFFGRGRYLIIVGLWLEVTHFLLDAIDTLLYMKHEFLLYTIVDTTETTLSSIGAIVLSIGLVSFSHSLLRLWESRQLI